MTHVIRDLCILVVIALVAASELVGEPSGPRPIAGGTFEASGVIGVPGSNGALFVDDGQTNKIFWMELDTRKVEQLTSNGAANFAPYPLPDDSGVLFSSNQGGSPREFDVWMTKRAGGEATRVTTTEGFDGFPMFSPDGKWLMFASNRATAAGASDTNLFVARWVP